MKFLKEKGSNEIGHARHAGKDNVSGAERIAHATTLAAQSMCTAAMLAGTRHATLQIAGRRGLRAAA